MVEGFEVVDADLRSLGPENAVLFFRELVWAAAADVGVPRSSVHVPTRIHVGDGGLDAKIEDADPAREDFIPAGDSGYQVKSSGMSYSSWKDDVRGGDGLQPRIERLLDDDGTYVLVVFEEMVGESSDRSDMDKRERWEYTLQKEFADKGYDDADVRVYDTSRLAGFVSDFPSLIAQLKDLDPARDYSTWARSERVSGSPFIADSSREQKIEAIRDLLRSPHDECPVVRVTGLPGIGKTRLVYEALAPDDLQTRVLYLHADDLQCSTLATRLERNEAWSAILVVDNCDEDAHEEFIRQFGSQSDRLALITISSDGSPVESDYTAEVEPLDTEQMVEILQEENPNVDESRLERIAEFAQGFPQFGYLLSKNIASDPEETSDNLLDFDTETPLRRLILGRNPDTADIREHRRVLEAFALFEKVAWQTDDGELHPHTKLIASLAGFTGTDDMVRFREIVERQRNRGILQGEYYLAVQPLPLATYLLQSWWETHGLNELLEELPPEMVSEFGERIPYMATFDAGRKWIAEILGPNGPFHQNDGVLLDTELGSQLFFKLAEADPRQAVDTLHDLLAQKSEEELLAFHTGRRQIVHALEYIAVWEDTFEPAARMLLLLGEAENEDWSNNASGVFAGLFSPGMGKLAPTEKPAEERLRVLLEALQSESLRRQQLGLNAAEAALKAPDDQFRTVGPEYQGARPTPNLWMPDTYGELFDYYRAVWGLLNDELPTLDEDLRQDGVEVLTGCVRSLSTLHPSLSEMIREDLADLSREEWVDEQPIIRAAVSLLEYDSEQLEELDDEHENWEAFVQRLTEASFERKLRRYAGQSLVSDRDSYQDKLAELAEDSIDHPEKLEAELSWLVTSEPNQARLHDFGNKVGQRDTELQFLDKILDAVRDADDRSVAFLSGYLAELPDRFDDRREAVLDQVEQDADLQPLLMDLIRTSGMTSADAGRIIDGLRSGTIDPSQIRGLELGGVSRDIEEPAFKELSRYLLHTYPNDESQLSRLRTFLNRMLEWLPGVPRQIDADDNQFPGALVLLPVYFQYYVYPDDGPTLPRELTLDLLLDPVFTEGESNRQVGGQTAHQWKGIAEELVLQYPDTRDELVIEILANFGDREVMIGHNREVTDLLEQIFVEEPDEIWPMIAEVLADRDSRSIMLSQWLSGTLFDSDAPVTAVESTKLWEWVDESKDERAPILASAVPATFSPREKRNSLAREVLSKYGDIEGVFDAISSNYGTESWWGPASEHYQQKKERLEAIKQDETDSNVISWVNQELADLDQSINQAEQFEERLGRRDIE